MTEMYLAAAIAVAAALARYVIRKPDRTIRVCLIVLCLAALAREVMGR